jgi:hypothetical protein
MKLNLNLNLKNIDEPEKLARELLFSKLKDWKYEEEVRVLTTEKYVPIEIKEVILGPNMSIDSIKYIKSLVTKYENEYFLERNEKIKVEMIKESIYDLENLKKHKVME